MIGKLSPYSKEQDQLVAVKNILVDAKAEIERLSDPAVKTTDLVVKTILEKAMEKAQAHGAELSSLKRLNEEMVEFFRACLTRQALGKLELNAFPPIIYNYRNLSSFTKWILALKLYRTPILNAIRAALAKNNLSPEVFARAATTLYSLISGKFARPQLEQYRVPHTRQDIEEFCSFVDKLIPDMNEEQQTEKEHEINKDAAKVGLYVRIFAPRTTC